MLDRIHSRIRQNRWFRYFAVFNRVVLALGFLLSGFVKVRGERFTVLAVNHPMGHYLDAFYQTGFYYTSVGIMQMTAALLLLVPRTATLGAVIYFPIILNIFVLTLSVRFDGSWLTAPLMVLANLYLLCWDYHKIKFILPFGQSPDPCALSVREESSNKFPKAFFAGVVATVIAVVMAAMLSHSAMVMPHNHLSDCRSQFSDSEKSKAGYNFCSCVHTDGRPLYKCLSEYEQASGDAN